MKIYIFANTPKMMESGEQGKQVAWINTKCLSSI